MSLLSFKSWRVWIVMVAAMTSILMALPSFLSPQMRQHLPGFLPQQPITLGLDLRGGVHLVLEVGTDQVFKETYGSFFAGMNKTLRQDQIFYKDLVVQPKGLALTLMDEGRGKDLQHRVHDAGRGQFECTLSPGGAVQIALTKAAATQLMQDTMTSSQKVIRKRIDQSGTLEPILYTQGQNRLVLQIPGFQDPAKVRALLGSTAKMVFHWVVDQAHPVPAPLYLAVGAEDKGGQQKDVGQERPVLPLDPDALMSGDDVLEARPLVTADDLGKQIPAVSLTMTSKGARLFADLTRPENHGRRIAIVLDQRILTAPSLNAHITQGQASISPIESLEKAGELATMISSGALPAPLTILEEKVVGPQLGRDSIVKGTWATALAVTAVAVWMVLVYGGFGIFSVVGILFNLTFLFAGLVFLGATLTLPGLAGIALTVGMAVDANVLINERIREEYRLGHNVAVAIENGYQRARGSIVDSNMTTLTGTGLLYLVGTGPVRGFAVTMALGILISMVTSMGLTHHLVRGWIALWRPQRITL